MKQQNQKILSIAELAEYTGYKLSYLQKLCSERKIPHYKPTNGRRVFFRPDEVNSWLRK